LRKNKKFALLRKAISACAAAAVVAGGLSMGVSASAAIPSGNLTVNPSFETSVSGWSGVNATIDRAAVTEANVGPDGDYAANVTATSDTLLARIDDAARTVLSTVAGTTYTADAYIAKPSSFSNGDAWYVAIREKDSAGNTVSNTKSSASGLGTVFKHITVDRTVTASGNTIEVYVASRDEQPVGSGALVDAITLTASTGTTTPPTTEPTTPPTTQPTTPPTTTPTTPPTTQPTTPPTTPPASGTTYPLHTNIVATTFWVGELFDASLSDGSQLCSTYDSDWAYHHTGKNLGTTPSSDPGCAGAIFGGCDGVSSGTTASTFKCATERRTAANGYFPTKQPTPLENPFYVDLPYDDLNDSTAFRERCTVIPWAAADNARTGVNNCANENYSYMKNRWVQITGPNGATVYAQNEDAGPSSGSLYHDKNYVFSTSDARPANKKFSGDPSQGAGMDVSPAVNGALGFADLDGDNDHISWRWVDAADVPAGPWKTVVTTSQVHN
jgi:hypothetical protein